MCCTLTNLNLSGEKDDFPKSNRDRISRDGFPSSWHQDHTGKRMDAKSKGVKPVFDRLKLSGHLFGRIALTIARIRCWSKNPQHLRLPRQPCYETFNDHRCSSFSV